MKKKINLLIIDPQIDFCMPGAALYVKGADLDMHRLAKFITENTNDIDSIDISLDMHLVDSISHSMYWVNKEGKHPEPFINITVEDVQTGVWKTAKSEDSDNAIKYLNNLKAQNDLLHTIWPYHCIAGTYGSNIFPALYSALKNWMDATGKAFSTHLKGVKRNTHPFGLFEDFGEFNINLIQKLFDFNEEILVAGQAKSHCVASSLKQILTLHPDDVKKITLLTDTTSNVEGCEHIADKIYKDLRLAGMKETTTEEYIKQNLLQTI